MRTRWGRVLGGLTVLASLTAACSSSSSSQGITSTTAAATTAAPATESGGSETTEAAAPDSTAAADTTVASSVGGDVVAGGVMTVGLDSEPPSLDPAGNVSSLANGSVFDGIYDTLMRYDDLVVQVPKPHLASDLTEADDRMSWTVTVRDGVTFHDGTARRRCGEVESRPPEGLDLQRAVHLCSSPGSRSSTRCRSASTLSQPRDALPNILAGTNRLDGIAERARGSAVSQPGRNRPVQVHRVGVGRPDRAGQEPRLLG
ncbi:MAG: hypothetical protein R2715_19665 [Ilumatobacteraceae bacterium]